MSRAKGRPTAADESVAVTHVTMAFDGAPLTSYVFRGRPCWIAADIGYRIGYADEGRKLVDSVRDKWADEFISGKDLDVLSGKDLHDFKELLDVTRQRRASLGSAQHITILYESGVDLVCTLTRKPIGRKLRRFLVDEVLPKLRRGESVGADAEPIPPLLRELFRDDPRKYDRFWPKDIVRELCRTFRIRQTQEFPAPLMGVIGKLYSLRLGDEAHQELRRVNPRGPQRDMHFQHFGDQLFDMDGDKAALRALLLVSSSKTQFWELWQTYCTGRGQLRLGW